MRGSICPCAAQKLTRRWMPSASRTVARSTRTGGRSVLIVGQGYGARRGRGNPGPLTPGPGTLTPGPSPARSRRVRGGPTAGRPRMTRVREALRERGAGAAATAPAASLRGGARGRRERAAEGGRKVATGGGLDALEAEPGGQLPEFLREGGGD